MKKYIPFLFVIALVFQGVSAFAQPNVSFTASETEACAPVNIEFTNTSTGCTGAATYYWVAGTGDVSNNENPIFNYSTGGVYTVEFTVSCDGFDVTETMEITIYDPPNAVFDEIAMQGCVSYTASFVDASTEGDATINEWQWYFGDGFTSDEQNPSNIYGSSGNFNVSLIVTDLNGCTDQQTSNGLVSVANQPVVSFTADNPASCVSPHDVNFTADITTSFGLDYTLVWDFGDGSATETGEPVSHSYSDGMFDVTLIATDEYGCESTLVLTDYIQIIPATPDYSVLEGEIVCLNAEAHFQNETSYGCSWDFGDGSPISYLNTPAHTYNTAGDMSVVFTVDPGGPCEVSTTFNLLVEEVTASFTTSPADLYSCTVPFSVDFTSTSSANATGFFYVFQDGGSATTANANHEYTSAGMYQPALTVTTDNGCSHTFIGPLITLNVPDASFTADTIEGCEPITVDFTYTGTTPVGSITNYNWDFNNGSTNADGSSMESSTFNAGEYTVTLTITDDNGCVGISTLDINVGTPYYPDIDVVVFEEHTPLGSMFLCPQDSVDLYLADFDNPDIEEFTWYIDSSDNNAGQEYQMWQFDQDTGWMTIHMITLYNGCRDTLLWDSVYISGPIINGISNTTDCANPLDFVFSLNQIEADYWDWFFYYIDGSDNRIDVEQDLSSTTEDYPITFPSQGDYWCQVIAYNNDSGCEFIDSVQVSMSSPQSIFTIIEEDVCIDELITFYSGLSLNCDEYYWDFGDGTNSGWIPDATTSHAYTSVGYFTVELFVRDGNGCENSMTDVIHVLGPEIHISADNTYGCNSLEVNFTDSSISDDAISWILWEFGDGDHTFGANVTHNYLSSGTYSVTVTISTVSGCESTMVYTDYITVATVSAMFASPDQTGCVGEEMSFSAGETDGTYIYTWNFGEGADLVGNNSTPTHTYAAGGAYDIYLEVDNTLGCVEEMTFTEYIIIEEPVANFSLAENNLPCYPVEPEIIPNVSVLPFGTNLTYQWIMGTNDTINIEDPEFLYTLPGTFEIILNLTTPNGCTDTYSQILNIDGPYADISISDTTVCVGEEVDFEITNQQSVDDFVWVVGGGDSYTDESFSHSYDLVPPQGYYPVSLTLTSGTCIVIFDYNIHIFEVDASMLVTDSESVEIIDGACSPYDALLTSNSLNDTYRDWYIDGDAFGTGLNPEPITFENTTTEDQTITISLAIEDENGCQDSIAVTIDVYALPQVEISVDTLICYGDAITISADGGTSYVWSPNESISAVNIPAPTIDPTENITYTVQVFNDRNCMSEASLDIIVQQEPNIVLTPEVDTIMIGDTVFSILTADQENLTFLWTPQTAISCYDCPEPYFYPEESMRYNLTLEDSMQCFRHNYYVDIVVQEEYSLDVPMAFTPLGSTDNRIVYVRGFGIRKLLQFRIYNRWGQEMFFTDDITKGWDGYFNGQLQNIDNYSYYVEAEMYDGTTRTKKGNIFLMR